MRRRPVLKIVVRTPASVLLILLIACTAATRASAAELASRQVLDASGLQGGLVVQIGCRQRAVAEQLASTGRFLVQTLDFDAAAVDEARKSFHAAGVYGLVSANVLNDGAQLPYAENLVNLLVLDPAAGAKITPAEALRVLCPGGVLIASSWRLTPQALKSIGFDEPRALAADGDWLVAKKPWPAEMDTWPQPRHGADGNVLSRDRLVGPPRRVRWVAGPPQEVANMVSSAGRNFYGGVLARDAFNGLRLWQQRLTPSSARGGYSYFSNNGRPATGPQPIAVGALLLAYTDARVVAFDGASGKELRQYPDAGAPLEMLADGGLLLALDKTTLRAVEIQTGRLAWKHDATEPRRAVAGDGAVYLLQGGARGEPYAVVALDLITGQVRWQRTDAPWVKNVRSLVYSKNILACEVSTLTNEKKGNSVEVLSAADGRSVHARQFLPATSHYQQARAIFIDDLMWTQSDQGWVGNDFLTGQLKHVFGAGTGHCFPPVATVRYLLAGEMHLTDLCTGLVDANPITKGNCSRDGGFMPANGLIYTAPKHCICWPMLRGYTALAPALAEPDDKVTKSATHVLERGPADAPDQNSPPDAANDWPCYRHDAWRSGSSVATIPTDFKVRWSKKLGSRAQGPIADDWRDDPYVRGPVTAPVVAGGRVYVARPDAHEIVALDQSKGHESWRFTADGRIDTPPTLHRGLCLFGTSGGSVYCLRADDGGLIWRFHAAPADQHIVAYGQVESPWPVPGSVLVADDVAYLAAGRHSLADGGIGVFALQPATGQVIWTRRLDTVPQTNFYDSSGLEFDNFDLLHLEGRYVTMSRWLFDRQTGHMTCRPKSGFAHLATGGSGVIVPRGFWSYAPRNESEHNTERPFVRPLLGFRDNRLYGFSEDRKTVFRRDFDLHGEEDFDLEWFKGWSTYAAMKKGGDLWRTQRLARAAQWTAKAFPGTKEEHRGGAIALAANAILVASQQGGLVVLSPDNGRMLSHLDMPPVVWDGLAVAGPAVYVSTQDGQVLCLQAK